MIKCKLPKVAKTISHPSLKLKLTAADARAESRGNMCLPSVTSKYLLPWVVHTNIGNNILLKQFYNKSTKVKFDELLFSKFDHLMDVGAG